jgi:hypothetical protein
MAGKNLNNRGPLQAALLDSSTAATKQAIDAQAIFNPIAEFLNSYCISTAGLK